jgi:hypothetical protein
MNLFQYITAEYTCPKCGGRRSVISPTLWRFYWIAAALAALPLWIASLCPPWSMPWYYGSSFLAGELLLVFLGGFLCTLVLAPFDSRGTIRCRSCRAMMSFNGRHFDPLGHPRPHWKDIVLFIVFLALNVAVWLAIAYHK